VQVLLGRKRIEHRPEDNIDAVGGNVYGKRRKKEK